MLQGVLFGRVAPPRARRRLIKAPALVLCHDHDPLHHLDDAELLAEELPNARFIKPTWMGELRLSPQRLTDEIVKFLGECWAEPAEPAEADRAHP